VAAIPVERTPPAIYETAIEPLRTPVEDVLSGREAFPESRSSGVNLLREQIFYVTAEGTIFRLLQSIETARDRAGVEALEKSIFTYDKDRERMYLLEAYTLQRDGSRRDIAESAAFIQTPQHEASNSLYTSQAELSLLFPDVREGSTTVAVVLREEFAPVMPGEFVGRHAFGAGWPTYRRRFVVEMPDALEQRLQIVNNSVRTPEVKRLSLEEERTRLIWEMVHEPETFWEESSPSFFEQLPSVYLSTLPDWTAVSNWFSALISSRRDLPEDLREAMGQWLAGVEGEEAIIRELHRHVANDIRYTGLEFGLAGYQPYSCTDVWANRYGDCKDKANLLATLLQVQGIDAHVALVQTRDHGFVERRSPSWGGFNHAIVAIRREGGEWSFCDPTVRYLEAGVVPFVDAAREVFVVTPEGGEWVAIPDERAGGIGVEVDLALDASGAIDGWMTLRGEGTDGAWYYETFAELEEHERQRTLQRIIGDFLPGMRVIDVDFDPATFRDGHFSLRAYVLRDPVGGGLEALRFPYPVNWLPSLNEDRERETAYRTIRRFESLEGIIRLPKGVFVQRWVEPFEAHFEGAEFEASWSPQSKDSAVRVSLRWEPQKAILTPGEFAQFRRAVFALKNWLDRPLSLGTKDSGVTATISIPELEGGDFPLLSTGEGQFRLLDERFPKDDFPEAHRAGLEKILMWFPDEVDTVFSARVRLALLDWTEATDLPFAETVAGALKQYGTRVTAQNRAWAQYLWARAAYRGEKDPAALETLRALVENETLNVFRRSWSAYYLGEFIKETEPSETLALWEEWGPRADDAQQTILSAHLQMLIERADEKALVRFLENQELIFGAEADARLAGFLKGASETWQSRSLADQERIAPAIEKWVTSHPAWTETTNTWRSFGFDPEFERQRREFVGRLERRLSEGEPKWWRAPTDSERTQEPAAWLEQMDAADDAKDTDAILWTAVGAMRHPGSSSSEFLKAYYYAIWWTQRQEVYPDLLDLLIDELDSFPADPESWIDACHGELAIGARKRQDFNSARKHLEKILAHEESPRFRKAFAFAERAKIEIMEEDQVAALASLQMGSEYFENNTNGPAYLLLELLLTLDQSDFERARNVLHRLRVFDQQYAEKAEFSVVIANLRTDLEVDLLENWWRQSAQWWPHWEDFAKDQGIAPYVLSDYLKAMDFGDHNKIATQARNDREEQTLARQLRLSAMLARWIPGFSIDLTKPLIFEADGFFWAEADQARGRGIEIIEAMPRMGIVLDAQNRQNASAAAWYRNDPSTALRLASEAHDFCPPEETLLPQQIDYYGMLFAVPREAAYDAYFDRLLARVAKGEWSFNPEETLGMTASILLEAGQVDDVRRLSEVLQTSLGEGRENASLRKVRELLQRHDASASAAENLTVGVWQWLADQNATWLMDVPPFTLEDYRFRDRAGPFFDGGILTITEATKANLLVALDAERPFSEREDAFLQAANCLHFVLGRNLSASHRFFSAIRVLGESHSEIQRFRFRHAIVLAHLSHDFEQAEVLLASAWANDLSAEDRALLTAITRFLRKFETAQDDALFQAAEPLLALPLGPDSSAQLEMLLSRLVYLGQEDAAESLLETTRSLDVRGDSLRSLSSYRLGFLRAMEEGRRSRAFFHYLRLLLGARLPSRASVEKGEETYRGLSYPFLSASLSPTDLGGLARYVFRSGKFRECDPVQLFTSALFANAPGDDSESKYDRPLQQALDKLLALGPDQVPEFASLLAQLLSAIDYDRPELRRETAQKMEAFLPRYPERIEILECWRDHQRVVALRSEPENNTRPAALYDRETVLSPNVALYEESRLQYHFARSQAEPLREVLDRLDFGNVHSLRLLAIIRASLDESTPTEEIDMLDDWIETIRLRALTHAYNAMGMWAVHELMDAAVLLDRPELFPRELADFLERQMKDPLSRRFPKIYRAYLEERWDDLEELATDGVEAHPEYYLFYGYRGFARARLGHSGAREDLECFLHYCGNSVLRPMARKTLREMVAN
jgi:transglutaminase-like putative cysteine protease